jgi:hypothetical protein
MRCTAGTFASLVAGLATACAAPDDGVFVAPGYELVLVSAGLDFPTGVEMTPLGLVVSEAGHLPGTSPTVKLIDRSGAISVLLAATDLPDETLVGPLADVAWDGRFVYVTHRQRGANGWLVGAISRFRLSAPAATFHTLVTDLPSQGDHVTAELVFASNGRAYFGQGAATDSGVVGPDNQLVTGWLEAAPEFHDFAPVPLVIRPRGFTSEDVLTDDPHDVATTLPFGAFGGGLDEPAAVHVPAARVIDRQRGMIAGNAAVYSFHPDALIPALDLRLEAWGLRNPAGLAFDPLDPQRLFVTNQGARVRTIMRPPGRVAVGSRPIGNDRDDVFVMAVGAPVKFFGWPDFFHDPATGYALLATDPRVCRSDRFELTCELVLDDAFRAELAPRPALAQLQRHGRASKLDVSGSEEFGHVGELFVAQAGAYVPEADSGPFVGHRVARVVRDTGEEHPFVENTAQTAEALFDSGRLATPVDVTFVAGELLIVDHGAYEPALGIERPGTGRIWSVRRIR